MHPGRVPCDDACRGWGDVAELGKSVIASKLPGAGRGFWNRFFLTALRRNQPYEHTGL